MTDKTLQLTPEQASALEQDKLLMSVVGEANAASRSPLDSLFGDAVPMSTLQYWSAIRSPAAVGHLKQALAAGEDVNAHSGDGYTALHGAAENGCLENVQLFLASGADVTIKTASGKTAADLARLQGHDAIVALLEPAPTAKGKRPWWKFW
ncbi:ankyrin repeat domain-containing protein [Roseateles depolymerans]|uniref:ankyrin repeat domain-containing protein n=1 Tax=Roseateles depolymerans TaxID=76731 RepID=UPI00073DAC05|nr:ankyrin repeat domain-containing protein [Roseateles depolymerans]